MWVDLAKCGLIWAKSTHTSHPQEGPRTPTPTGSRVPKHASSKGPRAYSKYRDCGFVLCFEFVRMCAMYRIWYQIWYRIWYQIWYQIWHQIWY